MSEVSQTALQIQPVGERGGATVQVEPLWFRPESWQSRVRRDYQQRSELGEEYQAVFRRNSSRWDDRPFFVGTASLPAVAQCGTSITWHIDASRYCALARL